VSDSKLIFDLLGEDNRDIVKSYLTSIMAEKAHSQINQRKVQLKEEAAEPQELTPEQEEMEAEMGEIDLALAQKNLELIDTQADAMRPKGELFLRTFPYKDKIVTLKKVGSGVSAPVVVYVDDGKGPQKLDTFMTPEQAERETKKILKLQAKQQKRLAKEAEMQEEFEGMEATVESLKNSDENGIVLVHEDASVSFLDYSEVSDLLEIHSRLNKKNKDNFEDKLSKSQESASDMLHYFQERIKRDIL
jgi:hypothetical protein